MVEPGERSDADLVRAHLDGDRYAFETLVHRHRDRLWAVALRTMRDPEEAADALQDALISAFRAAGSFRAESAVSTWLHRIVVNACLDRIRRRNARPSVSLSDQISEPADRRDRIAERETALTVEAALAQLRSSNARRSCSSTSRATPSPRAPPSSRWRRAR